MAKIKPNELCPCGSGEVFAACHGLKVINDQPPVILQRIPLQIIPEPDPNSRPVFIKTGEGTIAFQGFDTNISWDCGECAAPLIAGMESEQIMGIVIRCNQCGAFNDTSRK